MVDFNIEIDGLDEMVAAFKRSPRIVAMELNDALRKAIFTLLAQARIETPVDTGFLRGAAMRTQFGFLEGILENTADYAVYVHEGSRPHFPPVGAVAPWARRHGIPAFAVAKAIAEKGTKPVPFFELAIAKTEASLDNLFDKALENIVTKLAS